MFIVFEGIDGCGKTSQANMLNDYLNNRGVDSVLTREPGSCKLSQKIRDILLDKDNNIDDVTELLLFSAARSINTKTNIAPILSSGKTIICDRFIYSTCAYQGAGRCIDSSIIKYINELSTMGIKPDLVFYIDTPLEECKKRRLVRKPDRIEKENDDFIIRVKNHFDKMSAEDPIIHRINGDQDKHNVFKDVVNIVQNHDAFINLNKIKQ